MALRLIDITCSEASGESVATIVSHYTPFGEWTETLDDGRHRIRVVVHSFDTEAMLDELDTMLGSSDIDFRAVVQGVEATLPRESNLAPTKRDAVKKRAKRIAREELYTELKQGAELSSHYFAMVALSAIVAAVGLVRNDTAVLVGAMVIAPLLGPNMALTMAVTLGDWSCQWKALKTNLAGLLAALLLAITFGLLFDTAPSSPALEARSQVKLLDVVLALAAGSAGALSVTTGASSALVGVMVAVALMPPLVTVGVLLASGEWGMALGAAELVAANIIAINLSGILTFMLQGVRPRTWWEKQRASQAVKASLVMWIALLAALVGLILWSGPSPSQFP